MTRTAALSSGTASSCCAAAAGGAAVASWPAAVFFRKVEKSQESRTAAAGAGLTFRKVSNWVALCLLAGGGGAALRAGTGAGWRRKESNCTACRSCCCCLLLRRGSRHQAAPAAATPATAQRRLERGSLAVICWLAVQRRACNNVIMRGAVGLPPGLRHALRSAFHAQARAQMAAITPAGACPGSNNTTHNPSSTCWRLMRPPEARSAPGLPLAPHRRAHTSKLMLTCSLTRQLRRWRAARTNGSECTTTNLGGAAGDGCCGVKVITANSGGVQKAAATAQGPRRGQPSCLADASSPRLWAAGTDCRLRTEPLLPARACVVLHSMRSRACQRLGC